MKRPQFTSASCDTMVVRPQAAAAGAMLLAKNSDRPSLEAQPLRQFPRTRHQPGSRVHVQYIDLPQVEETAAMIGSQPHWLWGFEHGINEYGVVIGNEANYSKQSPGEIGLLGMDLIRLALERARTADQALEVITALVEEYGQGGAGYSNMDFRYYSSFIICDATEAWILDTSNRQWAARPARDVDSISNFISITDNWTRVGSDTESFAVSQGWQQGNERLDFQKAFRQPDPGIFDGGENRQARSCALLERQRGRIDHADLRGILRDHYESGSVFAATDSAQPDYYSLCNHLDPLFGTTASMIAEVPADSARIPLLWVSMATPCTSGFLPLFPHGAIPEELSRGGQQESEDSPWWRFKKLQYACAEDFPKHTPTVQALFRPWETRVQNAAEQVRGKAERELAAGNEKAAHDLLTAFMREQYEALQVLGTEAMAAVTD